MEENRRTNIFGLQPKKRYEPNRAKRFIVRGTIVIISLGVFGFGAYVISKVLECRGKCKINKWIPSYLLLATIAEMAHMPFYFVWIYDDLKSNALNLYKLSSWSLLISISVFGSFVVFPYVTTWDDTRHNWRIDQCPCFYWSFWWLVGTWFSLLFHFFFNVLMFVITPCMNRMIEERERRHYERRLLNDEERH